ncbi:unnamed protein product [Didymodactylos carnosus]|uniref:Uncharacterized protein n=1 Tax=Didymodactylos carnosus TaxID=1234261 RepID=A0A815CFC5_9BILA|nr:unnamed protein product [Didymodactylos carnosus]CAF4080777.1 unnamed protein product [Didymodactylos carnosus]
MFMFVCVFLEDNSGVRYPNVSRLMLQGKIITPRSIMTCLTKTIKLLNLKHLDLSFYCSGLLLLELLKQSPNIHTIEIPSAFLKELKNIKQLRSYTNNQIKKLILDYHHHFYHSFTREKMNDLLYLFSNIESLNLECSINTLYDFNVIVSRLLKDLKQLTYLSLKIPYNLTKITKDYCIQLLRKNLIDTNKIQMIIIDSHVPSKIDYRIILWL